MAMALLVAALAAVPLRDPLTVNPPFPRIGNCYGAGLGWRNWEQGQEYWSKLDLFVGGGYDLHYDWEHPRWPKALANLEHNIARLREVNPQALVLPYVDVVEGPDNPNVPAHWWDLRNGERWSGWPGYFRINTALPEVLQYNLDQVRGQVFARDYFDGVFYDCWSPDQVLCPQTAALRGGRAIVTLNAWNLPRDGFGDLNGCLAEDELNRVVEGTVDFEEFLARYLRWCSDSRRPVATMLVCHPRSVGEDFWAVPKLSREERQARIEAARTADPQMLRFGLCTTLLGDGYFGYDGGNGLSRDNWWWYPEFDAPLGYPSGPASRREDGTWQRQFDGGLVVVNGSGYDVVVTLPRRLKDFSTGRVGTRFTIPLFDGRILVPTDEPESPDNEPAPRLTRTVSQLAVTRLDDLQIIQTPAGLELRVDSAGAIKAVRWQGQTLLTGGFPTLFAPPFKAFAVQGKAAEPRVSEGAAQLAFEGEYRHENQLLRYQESLRVEPRSFTIRYEATAASQLDLRMWRHYFGFPVARYAGAEACAGDQQRILPASLSDERLLPASNELELRLPELTLTIHCSLPLGLMDHREFGVAEYLLAGYPAGGAQPAGRQWSITTTVAITPR
ncbi:MAG: hypothetical protein HUU35_05525 [Armatimonadetes bacterium]|nr:hypothetical protein [Armatimonadota bacterium]